MSLTRNIAVLAPHLDMHYYYVGILAGIHEVAQQHGVHVIGIRVDRPRLISPPSLCWDRVDGWIAIMHGEGLESIACSAPLVTIGGAYVPTLNCPTVMPDNAGSTEELVSHLIDHGHTHIAFVGYLENPDIRQRYEGYQRALTKRGITFDPRLICPCPVDGFGEHDGREAAKRLMDLGLPCTAIVGGTDLIAIGVMDALKLAHFRVPDDVAVVGFDDLYLAQYTTPALTTVRHPFEALGRAACRLVLAQIDGQAIPSGITYVPTTLVLRRSCGCGRAFVMPGLRTRNAPIAWQDALSRQLVDLAQGSRPDARTRGADIWPGAIDLVEGLSAAADNVQGPSPVALERAWQEAVALMVDLDTLHAIHTLLEQTGMKHLAGDSAVEGRLKAFLDLSYVEMMRAYRARNIGRTSRIQGLIHTNYEISTEISTWRGQGTGRGQRLAWLRHTPARWGCLGRWLDPEAGRSGMIVVTDTYTAAGTPLVPVGGQYTAASFPPDQCLPAPGAHREMVALVPFQTPREDWWILTLGLTLETQFLTDRENLGMWATLLGASLEREALLASLAAQQERLSIANRDLLAAKEVAEKADALKTRLLANVSHELRTPLDSILRYSQAALAVPNAYDLALPSLLQHDLQHIVQNSEHLIRLINDLLDLSRAEVDALELFPEPIATHAYLHEVFRSIAPTGVAGSEVRWQLDMPAQLPVIEVDPVRLRQILLNLLSNARKFTQAGEIVLGANVTPPHLHIWVKDTGIGIPADLQEHIFEPFVTGNEQRGQYAGIGLGLSITRRLVALHGGVVTLESQAGHGATFHVYLPLRGQVEDIPSGAIAAAEPAVLSIAARHDPAPAIAELARRMALPIRRVHAGDELATLLTTVRPLVVAWDVTDERPEDWSLIQHIRSHPRLCHVPFILYEDNQAAGTASTTNVVLKPLAGNALNEMIKALCPAKGNGPVLIVDDDLQARELYGRIVAAALPEYPVRHADGGVAALALLERETPSLIILDLMMPDIDGFAVLEWIRSSPRTQPVPVLVISGCMLTFDDIKRLEQARVIVHSKDMLTPDETVVCIQQAVSGRDMLPEHTSVLVKRTLAYIHQNYMRTLSRQEIADAISVNKHYLSRIFHQEQGISPWDYLNRYRIKRAKQLLLTTDASITAIAKQVGFDDVSYFGRIFHKLVGCSPREFRQHPHRP